MAMVNWCAAAFVGLVVVACGSKASVEAPTGGDGGGGDNPPGFEGTTADDGGTVSKGRACTTDAECGSGGTCNPATKTCACGGVSVPAEIIAPNLLVVLDRSCSMKNVVSDGKTKWTIAVDALNGLLAKNAGKVRFGLELFPDTTGPSCQQDAIAVPVAVGTETKIEGLLSASTSKADPLFPDGPCVTNIDTAMQSAKSEPSFEDKSRPSYVLLVTDGKQDGCSAAGGDTGTKQIISDLHAQGVDTFVVGFGAGVDIAQMNEFAVAGGQARAGADKQFYDASDEASLVTALSAIAKKTLGCSMKLASPPPNDDASQVYVFFDASPAPIARDATHAKGWDYDSTSRTVTFYGGDCEALKSGTIERASVVLGCPGGEPPANPIK